MRGMFCNFSKLEITPVLVNGRLVNPIAAGLSKTRFSPDTGVLSD
jgi:hypothetical protein